MIIISTAFVCFLSIIMDLLIFLKISDVRLDKLSTKVILFLILCVATVISSQNIIVSSLFEILAYYLLFHHYKNKKLILGSIFIFNIIDLVISLLSAIVASLINLDVEWIIDCILLFLFTWLIIKSSKRIRSYFLSKNGNILLNLVIYNYVSILGIAVLNDYLNPNNIALYIIFIFLIVIQSAFTVGLYYEIIAIQKKINKRNEQKLALERQKQLEEYATYLEESEDELRAFKHDYYNMLNALKISAEEGNSKEIINLLDEYTKEHLDSQALQKYKDANHIHIKSLKSIIISKLILYNFECRQEITQIPNVNEIDLVRIIGITCDNAIEESKLMLQKGLRPEIQIMFYSNNENEFEYEIRNKIHQNNISVTQIQESGYSTKKGHQGLGLANIQKIESKYPNMTLSQISENQWFDFYLVIYDEEE